MEARVTVVIPTWNRADLLRECLLTLRCQTFQAYELFVVDDASTDDTERMLLDEFPEARVIPFRENQGFCRAANAGLREAATEYVVLLNNDTVLDPEFLERLIGAADATQAAMVAPLILFMDEPQTVYGAGDRQRRNGRPESIGFREPLEGFTYPDRIFGVSGCAGLYRRELFERIGYLDERFGSYFEDSDLNFRARLAGFDTAFAREAIAYHKGSASLDGLYWRARQCCRNHALLALKNMPFPLLLRHGPAILIERAHQWRRLLSAARAELGLARALLTAAKVVCEVVGSAGHILRERRRIGALRVLTARQINELLDP